MRTRDLADPAARMLADDVARLADPAFCAEHMAEQHDTEAVVERAHRVSDVTQPPHAPLAVAR